MRRIVVRIALLTVVALGFAIHVPQALAFPYARTFGRDIVRSTDPIPDAMADLLARSTALDAASPLGPVPARRIFLTDGGWRWRLLTLDAHAFALTRPLSDAIVVNRSDIAADRAWNGAHYGGERTLAGVIAHETVHVMIRRHFGLVSALRFPTWKVEGYADCIAQESSLSDADAALLREQGRRTQALAYYDARRRVGRALAGGMTVEQLFTGDGR